MPNMKIQPQYFEQQVTCITCNNKFKVGTTAATEIRVDMCSECHPFYTGKQTFFNAKGRVERFLNKKSKQLVEQPAKKVVKNKVKQNSKSISFESLQTSAGLKTTPKLKKDKSEVTQNKS